MLNLIKARFSSPSHITSQHVANTLELNTTTPHPKHAKQTQSKNPLNAHARTTCARTRGSRRYKRLMVWSVPGPHAATVVVPSIASSPAVRGTYVRTVRVAQVKTLRALTKGER